MHCAFFTFLAAMVVTSANAATADTEGRAVAATCSNCHAASGIPAIPRLEGRPEAELTRALQAFRDGTRTGTVMPQLAKGYTAAQLTAVARWYATREVGVNRP